jgi:hypothetical protein
MEAPEEDGFREQRRRKSNNSEELRQSSNALMIEASTSETSVNFYQTTLQHPGRQSSSYPPP